MAGIGDLTGDNSPEVVVGARYDDEPGNDEGSVLLFSGGDGAFIRKMTDPTGDVDDYLGTSVASIGDVTFDGFPDIAAGAMLDNTAQGNDTGSVVIFSGADGSFVRKLTDPG